MDFDKSNMIRNTISLGTLDKLNSQLLFQKKPLIFTFEGFEELFHRQFTLLNFESFKLFDIQVSYKELFLNYAKGRHSKSKGWNYHKSIHFCTTKIHKIQVSSGIIHERRMKFDMQMIWRKKARSEKVYEIFFFIPAEKNLMFTDEFTAAATLYSPWVLFLKDLPRSA